MKRRTAIKAIPMAIAGITAAAKANLGPIGPIPTNNLLTERELNYAFELITDASTSGISCSFVAFAHYVSTLASAGDSETIRATAESLIDRLYREHNHYDETREQWLSESLGDFGECCDMDDPAATAAECESAMRKVDERHTRRQRRREKGGEE